MYNHLNPFDRGFTGFCLECLITFQERGKPLSRLPLHASQHQLIPNIKSGDSCLSNGHFILLDHPELSAELREGYVPSGNVKLVDYRLIGTTCSLHMVISDQLEYGYANHLLERMQQLLKEATRYYSINTVHITKQAYKSLLKTAELKKPEELEQGLVKLKLLTDPLDSSEYDAVFIQLNHLPWSDSNLEKTVGYSRHSLQEILSKFFEKSLVDLLMLAGEAGVKQIKLYQYGSIIKGLPRFLAD